MLRLPTSSIFFHEEFQPFELLHQPPEYLYVACQSTVFLHHLEFVPVTLTAQEIAEAAAKAKPPDPAAQRRLATEKRETAKEAVKPSDETYVVKRHKRKGQATAFALHDRKAKKQLCQLLETVIPDAEVQMNGLAADLNSGKMQVKEVTDIVEQIKSNKRPEG